MDEFPGNSRMTKLTEEVKPTERVITPIVTGKVRQRKKPLGTRMRQMFFEDFGTNVIKAVVNDVMIPAARDMFADVFIQAMERTVYGESRPGTRRAGNRSSTFGGGTNHVNYSRYSTNDPGRRSGSRDTRERITREFDQIVLESQGEGLEILDEMKAIARQYGTVSIRNLFELVGVVFHHTDEKWGWDLELMSRSSVARISTGEYLLDLPKAIQID